MTGLDRVGHGYGGCGHNENTLFPMSSFILETLTNLGTGYTPPPNDHLRVSHFHYSLLFPLPSNLTKKKLNTKSWIAVVKYLETGLIYKKDMSWENFILILASIVGNEKLHAHESKELPQLVKELLNILLIIKHKMAYDLRGQIAPVFLALASTEYRKCQKLGLDNINLLLEVSEIIKALPIPGPTMPATLNMSLNP